MAGENKMEKAGVTSHLQDAIFLERKPAIF